MRLTLGLTFFWGLIILGVVVLLLLRSQKTPQSAGPPPKLTCASLGDRARHCKAALLEAAGDFVEQASLRAGRSPLSAGGRRLALVALLDGAIGRGELSAECEKLRTAGNPLFLRLWGELERCWSERGCEPFVACLTRAAKAEEKAGRLPL
ncbi:MAG: hypothetical protein RBU30_07750 [Polyangia bacterium]|jgi:hypothetical protein|nr:hypothetical protein [Polyangia bacterium]